MSTPTINITQGQNFTDLFTICMLVRSLINDTQPGLTDTPGEGQIFTDDDLVSPFVQPLLNSSIRELYRELRNVGQPTLIKDNVLILGLPPEQSPTFGVAGEDPSVQVFLGFSGYFDGTQMHSQFLLPSDVVYMERVWERQNGSNLPFTPMVQPTFGLPSRMQTPKLAQWEWRNDNIWMVGSTQTTDLRLRYYCSLPQFFSSNLDFKSTFIPIIDCTDAVAYKTAAKYAGALSPGPGADKLAVDAVEQMRQLKLANTRRKQSQEFHRTPYGNTGDGWGVGGWGGFLGQ